MKYSISCLLILGVLASCKDQTSPVNNKFSKAHFRGAQAFADGECWISGSGGAVGYKAHLDSPWRSIPMPDSTAELRDIQVMPNGDVLALRVTEPAEIYMLDHRDKAWHPVFLMDSGGAFLDGMTFFDDQEGIAFGDPINEKLLLVKTFDGGKSWQVIDPPSLPKVYEGEAGFAASGTSIYSHGNTVWIGTGGSSGARVYRSADRGITWSVADVPLKTGEGAGIFSLVFKDDLNGIAVGGSYIDSFNTERTVAFSEDGGKSWELSPTQLSGYRSVVKVNENGYFAWGRTGMDFSLDGKTWNPINEPGYFAGDLIGESHILLVGRNGNTTFIEQKKAAQ